MEPSQVGICLDWIHGNMICCSVLRNKVLIIEKSIHPTSWHPFMDGTHAEETLYLTVQRVLYFTGPHIDPTCVTRPLRPHPRPRTLVHFLRSISHFAPASD